MGLPARRPSLLHTCMNDVPARLERLSSAFEANDGRRVEFEAHGLRGMCAAIGAGGCTMLFGELEQWAREDRAKDARVLLEPSIAGGGRAAEVIRRLAQL